MMKMDFDKEADELSSDLLQRFHEQRDTGEPIVNALRRAFLAGQESMRESASKEVPTNWCHNLLSGPESSRMPLSQQGVEKLLLGIKNNIRSLPLLEEPNKEVVG